MPSGFRNFVKDNFTPYLVTYKGESAGKFTAYYEAEINASYTRDETYKYPVYGTPYDLVEIDLKDFDEISKQIGADSDYVVLKIDVSGHKNFIFYKDTANPDSVSAYYTFEHIPKQLITIDNELTEKLQHI